MHGSHTTLVEGQVPIRDFEVESDHPNVIRVITRLNIGGPAIHTLLLTRELTALGYRTLLVAGKCEARGGDLEYSRRPDDQVRKLPELSRSVHPMRNLKALWKLWRLFRRMQPAVVHTHTAMAGCLGRVAAWLSGVPIIVHTYHGNSLTEYFSPAQATLFRSIERLLAHCTDALCVVSPQQARELCEEHGIGTAGKFRVVPLGLELDDYLALRPPPESGPLTVGWFGRMVPVKNVALLAATAESALRSGTDIRFVIAGDGPDSGALPHLAEAYPNRFEWLGWQPEILPAMARCDVLLQTSRNEGTPVALIQGMAAARPFVSTPAGGVVDMVAGNVRRAVAGTRWFANGVLAEARAESLAGVLTELAQDRALLLRMGSAARDFASRRYRKETLVQNVDELYRELMQRKAYGTVRESVWTS